LQDELAHDLFDCVLSQTELLGQVSKTERSVLLGRSVNETLHGSRLKGVVKRGLQEAIFKLWHARDCINAVYMVQRGLPVRFVKSSGCKHDMIFGLLCVEYERLLVIVKLDQAAPLAGDDIAGNGVLVFGKHGDLKQHRRDEVDGLECLEVDRHVCG